MRDDHIALYASCRVAVPPDVRLQSAERWDSDRGPSLIVMADTGDYVRVVRVGRAVEPRERREVARALKRRLDRALAESWAYANCETCGIPIRVKFKGEEIVEVLSTCDHVEKPQRRGMCKACGAGLREDGRCPVCESKMAAGL